MHKTLPLYFAFSLLHFLITICSFHGTAFLLRLLRLFIHPQHKRPTNVHLHREHHYGHEGPGREEDEVQSDKTGIQNRTEIATINS